MRITGGALKGRSIATAKYGEFRPTTDRVREAIFSALYSRMEFEGLRVLDLYAGSGALGLEALSRGAGFCTFIESHRQGVSTINKNVSSMEFKKQASVRNQRVEKLLDTEEAYDLVFADPPYKYKISRALIHQLLSKTLVHSESTLVFEGSTELSEEEVNQSHGSLAAALTKQKSYGDTVVSYISFEKIGERES